MRARLLAAAVALAVPLMLAPAAGPVLAASLVSDACPDQHVPRATFADVRAGHVHAAAVDCAAWWGIARGKDPETYDPAGAVTRAQMATFVARLVRTPGGRLPASPADHFADDAGSLHHFAINRLAQVGVVAGRGAGTYAPGEVVTRGQMASFLIRALEHRLDRPMPAPDADAFDDIAASVHRDAINKAAALGIAHGVAARRYDPSAPVTRGQMASFLTRTLQQVADDGQLTDSPQTLRAAADLRDFGACDDLLGHIKEQALDRVGPYGLEGGFHAIPEPFPGEEPAVDAPEDDQAAPPRAGEDFSDTNVQEEGVDEPDIVKTDGQRILTTAGGRLRWIDVTGETPQLAGSMALGSWEHELLVQGDRALVMHTDWSADAAEAVLSIVDVSQPATMQEVERTTIEGRIVSARMVDGTARVVVRSEPTPAFVTPDSWDDAAHRAAERRNREIVEQSTIGDWLPTFTTTTSGGALVHCDDVAHPPEFSGLGLLSVVTVDLNQGAFRPSATASVLAGGEIVYASRTGLYVATSRGDPWRAFETGADMTAELHAFDIADPQQVTYLASGKVRGWVLNQFSLSEHDGYLRVATTDSPPGWWDDDSESFVTVLQRQGAQLVPVGQVGDLGRGERIYAVRYLGDVGYVVTFREVDPLYVIDLSDPTAPHAVGELKITGFSAYLHPVGDGLLLGVGQDATEDGWQLGTQLSLFDVSDPANPTRVHQVTVEGGYSEVEWDHHAFLYWPPTGLVMLPVSRWAWDEASGQEDHFFGAIGWHLDPASGFDEVGRVSHDDGPEPGDERWVNPAIRRSLVVRDAVYTLSGKGLLASELDTLADRGWVPFE